MDFDFPEDIVIARQKASDFAKKEIKPEDARVYDKQEKFPDDLRKKAFELGIVDYTNPWSMLVTIEELCRADAGMGIAATVSLFGAEVIMLFGSDEQKQKYLGSVQTGKKIMGLAVTESGGGSDVAGIKTTAKREGDKFIVNGSKMFITNGSIADFFVMLVRTSSPDGKRHHGLSTIVVEADLPGFTKNKLSGKLGVRATNTAELILSNVEVPAGNLIGEEGKGFYYIMTFFNISRAYVAAQAIGIAQGALDRILSHLGNLAKSGRSEEITEEIQFLVADIATRVEASRLLTYKAASFLFQFKPNPTLTSMAKAYASETAVFATEKALEITGVSGITGDLERFFRDAKIMEIWEGTSEIEKLIISRNLLKEASEGN
ncbi:MAG: acyl-CoA/acyl-ACP dehydrogenase [Candidatus Thermoplasmatota archaeon]|jgi:acyl-CoA dehydrogenase|nr:acyl-CoA/acyl-ACP dehydrogenase [Candidatus Thermoplasmatota archaeon]MDA8143579.1 acyl-CoA/acyl-ACP dehydrogenase [Thermoplasmatales archaeon]